MDKQAPRIPAANQGSAPGSSPDNAAPLGTAVKTTIECGDPYMAPEIYIVEITVLETVGGKAAVEHVRAQGVSDKPPVSGFDYLLARINFGFYQRRKGFGTETYQLMAGQLAAVSEDGLDEYPIPRLLQQPRPELVGCLFQPGSSREGWILLQVPEDNNKPLLIFKREHARSVFGIRRHVWFKLF